MRVNQLNGKPILLVLVSRSGRGRIQLLLGHGLLTREGFEIVHSSSGQSIQVDPDYINTRGVASSDLPAFVAPVPGSEIVMHLAEGAAWCIPILVPDPLPNIPLLDSPFYGVLLKGTRDLVFLRPPSDYERDKELWGQQWAPNADDDEPPEDEELP